MHSSLQLPSLGDGEHIRASSLSSPLQAISQLQEQIDNVLLRMDTFQEDVVHFQQQL
ncbi:hypothetical protein GFV12_01190 [Desulfurobacterium thermolithotrophum]|uniref:hypothetical protein n=1 Tax=Desulfurobacterium thermolithotrophum TaxID=64160 RepID=UPI0039852390